MVVGTCALVFILIRSLWVIHLARNSRKSDPHVYNQKRRKPSCLLAVLGSGGHTKEMIALLKTLDKRSITPRVYLIADTDTFSEEKVTQLQKTIDDPNFTVHRIPRSREVRQTYLSSVLSTLYALLYTLPIIITSKADLVLCNGPGTCIPVCVWVFLSKILLFRSTKLVFIESICRVKTLSLTGKLLYQFADYFIVQWQELATKYPLTLYIGRLL